jgi:hypothetical protein
MDEPIEIVVRKPRKTKPVEDKKTADPKKYIREYKKKQYKENLDKFSHYYKYKYNLSPAEMTLYGALVPEVSKALAALRNIRSENSELLKTVLQRFAEEPILITSMEQEKVIISNESENIEIVELI